MSTSIGKKREKMTVEFEFEKILVAEVEKLTTKSKWILIVKIGLKRNTLKLSLKI